MTIKRYEWEDALIDAHVEGILPNGALLLALKLAKAINWQPQDGRPSGLYWKNEDAFKAVGVGRSTYYDHRSTLFDLGFFTMKNNNLIPQLPQSVPRTEKSVPRTTESAPRTEKSAVRNPYSEDIYSEDTYTEDVYTEDAVPAVESETLPLDDDCLSSLKEEGVSPAGTAEERDIISFLSKDTYFHNKENLSSFILNGKWARTEPKREACRLSSNEKYVFDEIIKRMDVDEKWLSDIEHLAATKYKSEWTMNSKIYKSLEELGLVEDEPWL